MDIQKITDKYYKEVEQAMDSIESKDLLKIGCCNKCGKEICTFNKVTKMPNGKNDFYRDYWIALDNDTKMRISVCDECVDNLNDKDIDEHMRKERNTQAYQIFNTDKSKQSKSKIIAFVSQYKHISHQKTEPKLKEKKDKKNG